MSKKAERKAFKEMHDDLEKEDYKEWIGFKVKKFSGKPFQNGNKTATISGVIDHPILSQPAFVFEDDDSFVSCAVCIKIEE